MIYLENMTGKEIKDATIVDIKKALFALFMRKSGEGPRDTNWKIIITNIYEEVYLEVYHRTIILQDLGNFKYDGPGGPGELLRIRVKEGSLSYVIEDVVNLLENYKLKKLIKVLKSLPKPDEFSAKLIKKTFDL